MAATISISVFTGTNAGTETTGQTGIDFISADNPVNSLANRQANPIVAGNRSFEKWLKPRIDVAPDNEVTNFLFWTDGAVQAETTLYAGTTPTGATPTDSASSVATVDATGYTSPGSELVWDSGSYTTTGLINNFLVLQLATTASAAAGNWTQETLNYSYDET